MSNPKGFMKIRKRSAEHRPVGERLQDYRQVVVQRSDRVSREQATRCMDCGTPFCHWGCPVDNLIPEWNEEMQLGNWKQAFALLSSSNILPEVTGRVCPAPCEHACVLGFNDDSVTIRENELDIIEHAFREGYVKPVPPLPKTGRRVAVVGSGPAGLACAVNLNRAGHDVTVFEKADRIGGIMRYGIPDFKLEKRILDRRIGIWKQEGITFQTGVDVGVDIPVSRLASEFQAVCLTGGCRVPRDLPIPGRQLEGIQFAMDYLAQSNHSVAGDTIGANTPMDASGRRVVVVGGGDTGADCVGTANRQGAVSVIQLEIMPKPPEERPAAQPWPYYPMTLRTSTSHEEGVERHWSVSTKEFSGADGRVSGLLCAKVKMEKDKDSGRIRFDEIGGTDFTVPADLVILAAGFVRPEHEGLLRDMKVELGSQGSVKTDSRFRTSIEGVFAAGDIRSGPSLVVRALAEGRAAAREAHRHLMGGTP